MYSLKKGLLKGGFSLLSIIGAGLAFTTFSDLSLWSLVEQYIKPLVGSLTVGGLVAITINYFKFRLTLGKKK